MSFEALGIQQHYIQKLADHGIKEPTDVQREAIPLIAEGKDVIAQSQTGTGKTLAYLLPVLQKLDASSKHVQALVLVPTRELGMQIQREIEQLIDGTELRTLALIGGAAIKRQVERLRQRPHIVVGTPGRILELIKIRKFTMHYVKTIIVDEVDHLFELGASNEVENVLKAALRDRQIAFFSATISDAIMEAGKRWMNEPMTVQINRSQQTAATISHCYFVTEERDKIDQLRRIIRQFNPKATICFVTGTQDIREVVTKLQYHQIKAEALYGESGKMERANVLNGFRSGKFQVLVATDIAARGLDIEHVSHVINYDLPVDADHYVHRVGRTGRAGQDGTAISIITAHEVPILERMAKRLNVPIAAKRLYRGEVLDG